MKPSVFAGIVTYRRPGVLRQCLDSLMSARDAGLTTVYVVMNSDDAEYDEVLKSHPLHSILRGCKLSNEGPAGGFHEVLRAFLESGCDFAWLMDDDVVVEANCLQRLLDYTPQHPYQYPVVRTGHGSEVVSFGWWGVLLARHIVEKAGLPMRELFYWAEDTEYLQNRIMRVHGFQPFRNQHAAVNHLHQRSLKRPSWYYYYTVRNTLFYRTYIAGYTWYRFRRTLVLLPYLLYMVVTKEERKWTKFTLMVRGLIDGLRGRTGKTVNPEVFR